MTFCLFTNKGPLAEQFVGQQLRAAQSPLTDPAVRINANLPEVTQIAIKTTKGDPVAYTLVSIPLYLAQQIDSLICDIYT